MVSLHVRKLRTGEIVHSVPLRGTSDRYVERVMFGMLRNMNTEEFFIDDSEVDEATKAEGGEGDA